MKLIGEVANAEAFAAERQYQEDKGAFIAKWRAQDAQMAYRIQIAIRHSVASELLARDARCYGLPADGKCGYEKTVEKTPGQKETILIVNPEWARVRHTGLDIQDEHQRRLRAFLALRPKYEYRREWLATIEADDGKDENGEWLAREHSGDGGKTFEQRVDEEFSGEVPPPKARRDVGFGVGAGWRRPSWLRPGGVPAEWCERPLSVPAAKPQQREKVTV